MPKQRAIEVCKKCENLCWDFEDMYRRDEQWEFIQNTDGTHVAKGSNVHLKFACFIEENNQSAFKVDVQAFENYILPDECPMKLEHEVLVQEKDGYVKWKGI